MMPRLARKTPCSGCPFRRDSVPGWLGASTAEQFVEQTLGSHDIETAMPCHTEIDYEDEAWIETQYPDAPVCAGSLIFMNNMCKLGHGSIVEAQHEVGTSPAVFARPTEFLRHHLRDPDGEWMTLGCRVERMS